LAVLRVKSGPQKGSVFEIRGDSVVLGREAAGQIQILDQGISRRHAEVFRIGEMFFIRDLESRNGTFVNDARISEEILRVADQIAVGNTVLVFEDRVAQLRDPEKIFSPVADQAPSPTTTIHLRTSDGGAKSTEIAPGAVTATERNFDALLQVSQLISEEKDLSRLFTKAAMLVGKALAADHAYILGIADRRSAEGLEIQDIHKAFEILGRFDASEQLEQVAGVSRGIIRDCLQHHRSVLTSDASLDRQFNAMESVVMNQLRSVICVPMGALGKSTGVLYAYSNRADAFASEDLELASACGIQLGSAIQLLKLISRSDRFFRNSIKTLVAAIELRTPKDHGKSQRVATYCLAVAKELGLDTQQIRDAWLSGMLHDVGSIPMSDEERQQKLTYDSKRNHNAREVLRDIKGLEHILPALEEQNERLDGSGSPEGIKGAAIHPLARILGLCLEFDRLLSERTPDGKELTLKEVLLRIRETADRTFDRQTVNALLIAYRNGKLFNHDEEFFEVPTE
jgi:HD-GYP domain-containing protein (c-di-GMP phosphodiesterase class II)/pSer/pThr/pTyr-binding forkhead associated (FHA) protein